MFKLSRGGAYVKAYVTIFSLLLTLLAFTLRASGFLASAPQAPQTASPSNKACGECHSAIYNSYRSTAMALTSGPAADHLITGSFFHRPSGVTYLTFLRNGTPYLSYRRENDPPLGGEQELNYYVGSGAIGRGYLYNIEGYWYQTPINFYSHKKVWDMSPGYESVQEMPLNHTVDPTCLYCHSSGNQEPTPPTQNHYVGPPFVHSGVTCERCHGDGFGHGQECIGDRKSRKN